MTNENNNLIVRLVPLNEWTLNAWKDPHNASFYMPASSKAFEYRKGSRRGTALGRQNNEHMDEFLDSLPEIRLTLNDLPKEISEGFVFGKDKDSCDVYCGESSKDFNVSRQAFSITINRKGQVVLKYLTSQSRISVQYGDQEPGVRTLSTWILFGECKKGIIVRVAKKLEFLVLVPDHGTLTEDYRQGCLEYLTNVESAVAILPSHNRPVTVDPVQTPTPKTKPFYYRCVEKELGSSNHAKIYLVYDASTGEEYAGKQLKHSEFDQNPSRIILSQNHVSIVPLSHTLIRAHLYVQTKKSENGIWNKY